MAIFNAPDLLTRPRHMGGYGNAVVVYGSVSPAGGAVGDVYRPAIIPAGIDVTDIDIINDDLDNNITPSITCKIGFLPVSAIDGPPADDGYFAPSGRTFLQSAGRTPLAFQPIKFEKPVFLAITLTASAANFVPGKITAIIKGDGIGVK